MALSHVDEKINKAWRRKKFAVTTMAGLIYQPQCALQDPPFGGTCIGHFPESPRRRRGRRETLKAKKYPNDDNRLTNEGKMSQIPLLSIYILIYIFFIRFYCHKSHKIYNNTSYSIL
jgi:hypothetical protein